MPTSRTSTVRRHYPYPTGTGNPGSAQATPCCITFGSIFDEKKRDALSGKPRVAPDRRLEDGRRRPLDAPAGSAARLQPVVLLPVHQDHERQPAWTNPTIDNGVVTGVTSSDFTPEMVNNTTNRNVATSMYGLKVDLEADRSIVAELRRLPLGGQSARGRPGHLRDRGPGVADARVARHCITVTDMPHGLPNLNVDDSARASSDSRPARAAPRAPPRPGYCSYTALMNSGFLNNNKYWSTHYDGLNGYSVHDQVTGFTLDGAWKADLGTLRQTAVRRRRDPPRQVAHRHQQRLDQRLRPVRHACTRPRAARCSARRIPSARRASTSSRSTTRPISCRAPAARSRRCCRSSTPPSCWPSCRA